MSIERHRNSYTAMLRILKARELLSLLKKVLGRDIGYFDIWLCRKECLWEILMLALATQMSKHTNTVFS